MKKRYQLKEKYGVLLFYIILIILTIIYSGSIR